MVSPDRERSGASHSVSLSAGYIDVKEIAVDTWICGGTPVDCILAVLSGGINFNADLIVSGINAGCNLGTDILFSGTAAAAREGALYGVPAIAFSLVGDPPYFWDAAALWSASHINQLLKHWNKDVFINVNIPNIKNPPDEPELTFPSRRSYKDSVTKELSPAGWTRLCFNGMEFETFPESGSDYEAVTRNKVAVSAVKVQPVAITL
jgi:5'-nucleotidase